MPSDAKNSPRREQRSGLDRRRRSVPQLKYLLLPGRRQNVRRCSDRHRIFFFDRYRTRLFVAIVVILLLSVLDALLTLYLMENGSGELNPVMGFFISRGPLAFMAAKYILTCLGVVILLVFQNVILSRPKIYTHALFSYIIVIFSTVIVWELYLIFFMTS